MEHISALTHRTYTTLGLTARWGLVWLLMLWAHGLVAQTNPVCPPTADFNLITPCYVNGARSANPTEPVIVLFNHATARGTSATKQVVASYDEVGSVWGLAYKPHTKKLYAAAFLKRHCDLAPDGLGAIYEIDLTTPTTAGAGTPTLWMNLNSTTHLGAGATLFPTETPANRGLGAINQPSRDEWAYTRVGKQGLGDIEITADGTTMYVMDLTNRQVLQINMATKTVTNRYAVNAPANYTNAADRRPFGIKHYNGELYIGVVSSGETDGLKKDIRANVMKLSGSSFTSVYEVDSMAVVDPTDPTADHKVTSYRGNPNFGSGLGWLVYTDNDIAAPYPSNNPYAFIQYPCPLVSDIEFDKAGNMVIGIMDWSGHRMGSFNYRPFPTNTAEENGLYNIQSHGDVIRAIKSGSTWVKENGVGDFYNDMKSLPEFTGWQDDTFKGGMIISDCNGTELVVANMQDPYTTNEGGVVWMKTSDGLMQTNTTGTRVTGSPAGQAIALDSRVRLYLSEDAQPSTFGKAAGLGDIVGTYITPACAITLTATPGTCNTATNQYTVSGTISLTNASAGTATVIDGAKSTTVTIVANATSVAYSLTGLTSGTGSHTVTVNLPGCGTATATYSAPASCSSTSVATGCPGNLLSNGSLENGTFNAFTTSNPNINGTTATYGGSQSIFLSADPSGSTLPDKPITGFEANTGYWIDATTNTGLGAKDGNRLFAIPAGIGANKCLFPNTGLGFAYLQGNCYKLCFWAAQFDPASPNNASLTSVFNFEYEDTFGVGSPGTVSNISVSPSATDNTGSFRSVSWILPASTNVKTTTGAVYTGGNGQTVDWTTLNWQYICLDFTPAVPSNQLKIYLSTTNVNNGVALDGICATPCSVSTSCALTVTATPGVCNTATNQYTVSGSISLTNASAGTATVTDGARSTTVTVAAGATAVAYSLTGLTSGTGLHTVTVSLPGCGTASTTYSAPASCSVAVCSLTPSLTITSTAFAPGSAPSSETVTLNAGVNLLPENNVAGFLMSPTSEGAFYALCTEISQPILPLSNPYTHELNNTANGYTTAVALRLAQVVQASGFNSNTGFGAGNNTMVNFVALQLAVWNALYDTDYSVTAGNFQSLTDNNGARTLANTWLTAAQAITTPTVTVHNLHSAAGQDLLKVGDVPPSVTATQPTCAGGSPSNNGGLTVVGFTVGQRYQYSPGTSFASGSAIPASISAIPGNGIITSTLSNSSGSYTVRIYHATDNACFVDRTVSITAAVCVSCSLTATATPGTCNTATNQYTVSGNISLTANTAGGTATITDGARSTTVTVVANATSVAYSLTGLTSGTGSHTVTVTLVGCGTASATYSAPASCTVAQPILAVVVGTPVCNTASNNYTATGTVSLTNAPAGSLTVTDNGTTIAVVSVTAGQTSASFSVSGASGSSPASHTVVANLGATIASTTYTTPASCTFCSLSITTSALASGTVGTAYSQTIVLSGAVGSPIFTSTGALPAGLNLNAATGVISGTPNAAGTSSFTVRVTDGKNCSATVPLTVNILCPVVTASIVGNLSICQGTSTTLIASGGTSYLWSTGQQTASIAVAVAGTYSVTATATPGCSATANATAVVNPLPILVANSATICAGQTTTLTASGAASYNWNQGGNTASIVVSPTVTTTYSVTGISAAGCPASTTARVTVSGQPQINGISQGVCVGNTASLTVNAINTGAGTLEYSLNGGAFQASNNFTINAANSVTAVVMVRTQGSSCSATESVVVNCACQTPVSLTFVPTALQTCAGSPISFTVGVAGVTSATLTSSGSGTLSQNTIINNGIQTVTYRPSLADATAGSVTLTLTSADPDGAGPCQPDQVMRVLTINPVPSVSATSASVCAGGTATLMASGAATYRWSTGATTQSISVSVAGAYSVTGTTAQGCSATANGSVTVYPAIVISPTSLPAANLGIAYSQTITATGGVPSYSFTVLTGSLPAGLSLNPTTGVLSGTPTSAATVSFTVRVTDSKSCSAVLPYTVGANQPSLTVTVGAPVCNTLTNNYTATGTVSLTNAPAGTLTITDNGSPVAVVSVTAGQTSASFSVSGTSNASNHTVVATLSNGVTVTSNTTYQAPASCTFCSLSITTSALASGTVGTAYSQTIAATGATGSLTFVASGTLPTGLNLNAATGIISGTPTAAGTSSFTVRVTDAKNCSATVPLTVNIVCPSVTASIAGNLSICAGASTTLTASGGASYLWSTGATTTSISVNVAGTYSVTATATPGCSATANATAVVNPLPILVANSATICAGQTTTLTASGAASYNWSQGGNTASIVVSPTVTTTYSVTGISAAGCPASTTARVTVSGQPQINGISQGVCVGNTASLTVNAINTGAGTLEYSLNGGAFQASNNFTINAANSVTAVVMVRTQGSSCSATESVVVNCACQTPVSLTFVPTALQTCAGSPVSFTVGVAGATSATLTTSGTGTFSQNVISSRQTVSYTPSVADATAGNITLTLTSADPDGVGSCAADQVMRVLTINPVPSVSATSASICAGGTTTLMASGASTYRWSTGATTQSISVSVAGAYSVTGTTAQGCSNVASGSLTVFPTPTMSPASLPLASVGIAYSQTLTGNGGRAPYGFSVQAGTLPQGLSLTAAGVLSGVPTSAATASFTVLMSDANGCTAVQPYTMGANQPSLTVSVGAPVCNTVTNNYTATGTVSLSNAPAGTLTITDNGVSVAVFSVTAGQTSASFSVSGVSNASSHTVVATLSNGVTVTSNTTYQAPASCTFCSLSITTSALASGTVGTAYSQTIAATGATGSLTFVASGTLPTGLNLNAATGIISGTPTAAGTSSFTVRVTDAKNCSATVPLTVSVVCPNVAITANSATICSGQTATLTASGAATYEWSTGAQTASIQVSATATQTYSVTGISATGCPASTTARVIVNGQPQINSVSQSTACVSNVASLTVNAINTGAGTLEYSLNGGAFQSGNSFTLSAASSTTAVIVVRTQGSSCSAIESVVVNCACQTPVSLTFVPTALQTCAGAPVSFTVGVAGATSATLTTSGTGTFSQNVISGRTTVSYQPSLADATAGSVTLTLTSGDPDGAGACVGDQVTRMLTISPTPSVSVNSMSVCAGQATLLTASGASTYRWSTGETTQSISVSVAGAYSVTGTTAQGCSATAMGSVTIQPVPTLSLRRKLLVNSNKALLSASGCTGGTINWSTGATNTSSITVTIPFGVRQSYTAICTTTNGCSAVATISLNRDPQDDELAVSGVVVCSATSAMLSATGCTGGSLLWSTGATTRQISVLGSSASYTVICTDALGTQEAVASVSAVAAPSLTLTASPSQTITVSNNVTLTVTGCNSGTVNWSAGITGQMSAVVSPTLGSNTYSVTCTVTGGCSATSQITVVSTQAAQPQLVLKKVVSKNRAKLGEVVSYTVTLANTGAASATDVVVSDTYTAGVSLVPGSVSASTGNFTPGASGGQWTIASLPAGTTATLTFSASLTREGVSFNTASIPDQEVTVCTTVPVQICKGQPFEVQLGAPAGYNRYQWYLTPVGATTSTLVYDGTLNSFSATVPGEYQVVVNNGLTNVCPAQGCCPVVIEEVEVPSYTALVKNPSCVGSNPQPNGQITLVNLGADPGQYVYQVSRGTSFSTAQVLSATAIAVPANGVVATGLLPGNYTIRVWLLIDGVASCPRDLTVAVVENCTCPAEICLPVIIRKTKSQGKPVNP